MKKSNTESECDDDTDEEFDPDGNNGEFDQDCIDEEFDQDGNADWELKFDLERDDTDEDKGELLPKLLGHVNVVRKLAKMIRMSPRKNDDFLQVESAKGNEPRIKNGSGLQDTLVVFGRYDKTISENSQAIKTGLDGHVYGVCSW